MLICNRAISMTYVRSFSFSDDSVDVDLPGSEKPQMTLSEARLGYEPWTVSPLPQMHLMEIRRTTSLEYQALIGSSNNLSKFPKDMMTAAIQKVRAVIPRELDGRPDTVKHILHCETFFGCMLLLCAPGTSFKTDKYGLRLFFEYAIGFAQSAWLMCHHFSGSHLGTCLDLERACLVGSQLAEILLGFSHQLFDDCLTENWHLDSAHQLLSVVIRTPSEMSTKAIDAITQLDQIVDVLGRCFGKSPRLEGFRGTCLETLRSLYARQTLSSHHQDSHG